MMKTRALLLLLTLTASATSLLARPTPRATSLTRGSPIDLIMIHGLPNGFDALDAALLSEDWTAGCIAVSNEEIEELWRVVRVGTVIEIRP